jgi:ParB family transcriptional regulator, chromosome partitioning protein
MEVEMARIREVKEIRLADLEIGKGQVRLRDVGKEIDELADSIRKVGLLEPIVVCEAETPGKFEIITGQRRFLAHKELKKETILAAILDQKLDETAAKVISVTENLIRRDLNSRDLIDACTFLFKKYGTIKAVAEETGLPQRKVALYVKYDQLVPQLKDLVDRGELTVQTALRAQQAASVSGEINPEEAVEFAKEMAPMSGAQQTKIVDARNDNPNIASDEVIENAKAGGKITQIVVTLSSNVHASLRDYAKNEGTSVDDAAQTLLRDALSDKGFLNTDT